MGRIALLPLVLATLTISLWMGTTKNSNAQNSDLQPITPINNLPPQLFIQQRMITVIGQGLATAPADTASLQFRFGNRQAFDSPAAGSPTSTQEPTLPVEAALQPIVDALLAIKVPAENIEIQSSSLENPKLLVKLNQPTRSRVQEVVRVASSALKETSPLFIQGISAEYGVNNCQILERTARRAAIKDAQNQAKGIALDLGIKVGNILFVTVYPLVGSPTSSSCGSKVGLPSNSFNTLLSGGETVPPYNPSALPEVQVRSQVSISYTIQ